MSVEEMIFEYVACAERGARTDYPDAREVEGHNRSADRMHELVLGVATRHPDHWDRFVAELLRSQAARPWIAHHALEQGGVSAETEASCLLVVRTLADGDGPEAFAERSWLLDRADLG
jgi:hypothetical protein